MSVSPEQERGALTPEASLRALYDLALAVGGLRDPVTVARVSVERTRLLLGVDGAVVYCYDPDAGLLVPLFETESAVEEPPVAPGEGAIGQAFQRAAPVLVPDYRGWEHALERSQRRGMVSALAVPLITEDRPVGAAGIWTYAPRDFTAGDSRLLQLVAAQIAPALEAARLTDEAEAKAELFEALNELARAASGLLEPGTLARLAADRARQLLRADSAGLVWLTPEGDALLRLADNDPEALMPERLPLDHGVVGEALRKRQPVVIGDYQAWERAFEAARGGSVRSAAAVPLLVGDRALGALVLRSATLDFFDAPAIEAVSLLAAQVAPALAAASLHADLAASEHRFRSLFETIACGVLVQGPGGVVLDANRAAEEMLGLPLEEMTGRSSVELWEVDDAGADRPALLALQTGRPILNHVFRIRRRDGSERWLQADSIPVLDAQGNAIQAVSSLIDVSEQRRAQDALRQSEETFRAVFDRAGIGICRVSLDGTIEDANPALLAMLSYQREEVVGQPAARFVHEDDLRDSTLGSVADGNAASAQAEIRCLRRDGSIMWSNATLTPVYDHDGRPEYMIGMIEDVTARKAQESALAHQALHDALTDLPNRALLQDRLHHSILLARRERHRLALLMMDLDRFKEVNDTFGHHLGDLLLRDVAARLRRELRGSDTVARLGGDEFAILLGSVEETEAATTTARKLLRALDAPFRIEGEDLHVGASIGIAIYPNHGADADLLMRHADVAMYVAKRAGSGFSVYAKESDQHTPGRLAMINDLRAAIERGELELHYQPKVEVGSGAMAGVEALARWRHPRLGLLLPEQFIGLAEHTGLIRPLGLWVIEAAIQQAAEWRAAGRLLPVAVNLSMRNIHDPQLADAFERLVVAHGVGRGWLQVEITESTLMADPDHALRVVRRLAELGVEVSIDDFGTGYSSLAYLKRLPVSEIKIDRSFVIDMPSDENAAVIVRSTIDLGHNLGLKVVAEGVEDERMWSMVQLGGCDLAQGNWICPAVPAAELPRRLPALAG
jgi:diguanylate cyclase (GGDEF)-like protein/PAS domain S-box-containing protein